MSFSNLLQWWHGRKLSRELRRYRRSVDTLAAKIADIREQQGVDERRLEARESLLAEWRAEADQQFRAAEDAIAQARKTLRLQETALEFANDRIRALEDVTVKGLVESNEVFIARWRAESQIQTARGVQATPLRLSEDV